MDLFLTGKNIKSFNRNKNMLVSLIGYIAGYILFAIVYCGQARTLESKEEKFKWILTTLGLSAFWPAMGVWLLWESISVIVTMKRNSGIKR